MNEREWQKLEAKKAEHKCRCNFNDFSTPNDLRALGAGCTTQRGYVCPVLDEARRLTHNAPLHKPIVNNREEATVVATQTQSKSSKSKQSRSRSKKQPAKQPAAVSVKQEEPQAVSASVSYTRSTYDEPTQLAAVELFQNGQSKRSIAEQFGCDVRAVNRWIAKHGGVKPKQSQTSKKQPAKEQSAKEQQHTRSSEFSSKREQALKLMSEGASVRDAAQQVGASGTAVNRWRKEAREQGSFVEPTSTRQRQPNRSNEAAIRGGQLGTGVQGQPASLQADLFGRIKAVSKELNSIANMLRK